MTEEELKAIGKMAAHFLGQDPNAPLGNILRLLTDDVQRLRGALELVMLYHSASPWDAAKDHRWQVETGRDEATTRALCDHIRVVLAQPLTKPT